MFLLYFVLLIVVLVLVHELGHFLVARWMGVQVLSFSIGFGPTVLQWQRGATQYAIRALPLGGFVRMLGDDPQAPLDPEIASHPMAFQNKAVWRRALIVAAGPFANLVLPVVILLTSGLFFESEVVSTRLGTVMPEGPAAQAGLRAGDRVLEVAGQAISTFDDLRHLIAARPGQATPVTVERQGQRKQFVVTPAAHRQVRIAELGLVDTVGLIEVRPDAQSAVLAVRPASAAWLAGLRSGDRVTAIGAKKTLRYYEFEEEFLAALAKGQDVSLTVQSLSLPPRTTRANLQQAIDNQHKSQSRVLVLPVHGSRDLAGLGLDAAQRVVGPVLADSPADRQAGLFPGDEILALDGQPARSFMHLLEVLGKPADDVRTDPRNRGLSGPEMAAALQKALSQPYHMQVRHILTESEKQQGPGWLAQPQTATTPVAKALANSPDPQQILRDGWIDRVADLKVEVTVGKDDRAQLDVGMLPVQAYEQPEMVPNPDVIGHALLETRERMGEALQVTALTVVGLFRRHVPVKEVGGVIFMAQLASRTADLGWGYFFDMMVWLSVNLCILNLLPIPLVDGGHLLFLAIEAVKREPVSLRIRQISAYIGMSLLGLLFIVVMKNDIQRVLPDVLAWFNRLFH